MNNKSNHSSSLAKLHLALGVVAKKKERPSIQLKNAEASTQIRKPVMTAEEKRILANWLMHRN
ncbi:MAG: hypothetical protein P1U61_07735 [Legionellaceae bacterium]|nr:hypothetical protein [Legionellaceae bacterium]